MTERKTVWVASWTYRWGGDHKSFAFFSTEEKAKAFFGTAEDRKKRGIHDWDIDEEIVDQFATEV